MCTGAVHRLSGAVKLALAEIGVGKRALPADTYNKPAILAPMCPGQRDHSFSINDPRQIGCIDF